MNKPVTLIDLPNGSVHVLRYSGTVAHIGDDLARRQTPHCLIDIVPDGGPDWGAEINRTFYADDAAYDAAIDKAIDKALAMLAALEAK